MGVIGDVRRMRQRHPSSWPVAWSRVMSTRSPRIKAYLRMTPDERAEQYRWLRSGKRTDRVERGSD